MSDQTVTDAELDRLAPHVNHDFVIRLIATLRAERVELAALRVLAENYITATMRDRGTLAEAMHRERLQAALVATQEDGK